MRRVIWASVFLALVVAGAAGLPRRTSPGCIRGISYISLRC